MKVTTSVARKDYPGTEIKKGDTYYSWAFFRGPKMRSKTYPRPSQLCGSSKRSNALAVIEGLEDDVSAATCIEDVKLALEAAAERAQDAIDEYEESISNLQEAFQGGCPALEEAESDRDNIQQFLDDCETAASDVEDMDLSEYEQEVGKKKDDPTWDDLSEDGQNEALDAAREIANNVSLDL